MLANHPTKPLELAIAAVAAFLLAGSAGQLSSSGLVRAPRDSWAAMRTHRGALLGPTVVRTIPPATVLIGVDTTGALSTASSSLPVDWVIRFRTNSSVVKDGVSRLGEAYVRFTPGAVVIRQLHSNHPMTAVFSIPSLQNGNRNLPALHTSGERMSGFEITVMHSRRSLSRPTLDEFATGSAAIRAYLPTPR